MKRLWIFMAALIVVGFLTGPAFGITVEPAPELNDSRGGWRISGREMHETGRFLDDIRWVYLQRISAAEKVIQGDLFRALSSRERRAVRVVLDNHAYTYTSWVSHKLCATDFDSYLP